MVMNELTGVSWNIGAALIADYETESSQGWANKGENVEHVIATLAALNPDVTAIQESHTQNTGSRIIAKEIALALDMDYIDYKVSPSHVDGRKADDSDKYWLSLAILSKIPIKDNSTFFPFPQPKFDIYLPGKKDPIPKEERHEKGMLSAELDNGLHVVSSQTLPARFLGFDYTRGKGTGLTDRINERLLEALPVEGDIFFGGDLNYDERWGYKGGATHPRVTTVFRAFDRRGMQSVFPRDEPALRVRAGRAEANVHDGTVKTDYVLVTSGIHVVKRNVIKSTVAGPVLTDHYPLQVVFKYAAH